MADDRVTRRELLRGRTREVARPPAREPGPLVKPGQRLPDLISWLDPEMRATPRRADGGSLAPALRPPGAIAEAAFLEACTRCSDCASACPEEAIRKAPERLRDIGGTPIVEPLAAACAMCEDLPCIAACETGALRPEAPAVLGTAHIQPLDCLNRLSASCSVCVERCPVPGALVFVDGVPVAEKGLCTGCGVCQHVCPAPVNAVLVLPNPDRPSPDELDQIAAASLAQARAASADELAADDEVPLVLAELHEAVLDDDGLRALFRDLAGAAEVDEVKLKQAARERASAGSGLNSGLSSGLDQALELLLSGGVRGVQIRYRYQGESWCDTILQVAGGHRVVRMADGQRPSGHA